MKQLLYIAIALVLLACNKKEVGPQHYLEEVELSAGGVYIVNEGNFMWGNGSVSFYQPNEQEVTSSVFQGVNGVPLGDVPQSMVKFNANYYIMVNSSGKIEVVDTASFSSVATITGLNSPRYFLGISPGKAYVTDLYSNGVSIINLTTHQLQGQIPVNGWTEALLMASNKVFVANKGADYVVVIDPNLDVVTDTIVLSKTPNSMVVDGNDKLWVLCDGGVSEEQPVLYRINPNSLVIEQSFTFANINASPGNLQINAEGTTLYFLNQDVFKMNTLANALPGSPFILAGGRLLYGLGIDPKTEEVYVADAVDYVQQGVVWRYGVNAAYVDSFKAGIIPGFFYFD